MKPIYWVILAGSVLILAVFMGWDYVGGGKPAPAKLYSIAMKADAKTERNRAASQLISQRGPDALNHIRRLATDSQDNEVLVIAFTGLMGANDSASMPLFYAALDNPDRKVREMALGGLLRFMGGALPENLQYKVDDPPENRRKVVRRLQDIHKESIENMKIKKQERRAEQNAPM